jgi:monoamine oxidase
MPHNRETLIIGAGIAGLAAAARLASAGRRSLILEARDRIGGRIHTLRPTGWPTPVEGGPEFVHGRATALQDLLRTAGIQVSSRADEHREASQPHEAPHYHAAVSFDDAWNELFARLHRYSGPDLAFSEFLQQQCSHLPAAVRNRAIGYVEGFNAADQHRVSVHWLQATEEQVGQGGDEPIVRIPGGYDQVTRALQAAWPPDHVELRYPAVVNEIRWRPGHVQIEVTEGTASHTYEARHAVVTLPLGVLQQPPEAAGSVRFVPELPEKRAACRTLHMGSVVKVVLRFREPFWRLLGGPEWAFLHTPEGAFQTWWPCEDSPVLTGWSGGSQAEALVGKSEAALVEAGLTGLAREFGLPFHHLEDLFIAGFAFDWHSDPFSRGAYSSAAVGHARAANLLASPVADTLFFAGEATEQVLAGTVAGALASGYRAADEVLQALT